MSALTQEDIVIRSPISHWLLEGPLPPFTGAHFMDLLSSTSAL